MRRLEYTVPRMTGMIDGTMDLEAPQFYVVFDPFD
jgi:hypothetical protein